VAGDAAAGGAQDVFLSRLHVRYDAEHFPEDLVFQETGDRTNFQGRYVLRHPWRGQATCDAANTYRRQLPARLDEEARNLARLTGWPIDEVRRKIGASKIAARPDEPTWYERLRRAISR
jgi:hypothetical protein